MFGPDSVTDKKRNLYQQLYIILRITYAKFIPAFHAQLLTFFLPIFGQVLPLSQVKGIENYTPLLI